LSWLTKAPKIRWQEVSSIYGLVRSLICKNRQKAVALLDKNPNDKHVNVLRAIAKGAGLADGNIPLEACRRLPNIVLRRQRKAAIQVAVRMTVRMTIRLT
jgi:hypothetical protein